MRTLELLSPARDASVGRAAILAGADAVYIGAPAFGARAAAGNSVEDIAALVEFAHQFRVKVYVTMNTILYDNELEQAKNLVWQLYTVGVDALIVQDMAYLRMELPPIPLHASTQCDIRTPEKAQLLAQAGFSQLVLPREFSLEQIKECADTAGVPVEVFIHGALCVSYSGDCQAGYVATGRSANRGTCPQMCRLPYELVDEKGEMVAPSRHYLSLRDLDRSADIDALVGAGVSSFKIEGRLKDEKYVTNVTAAYSAILNSIVAKNPHAYERSSKGVSSCSFTPDLQRTFNRGYTSYFLRKPALTMASLDTPKWAGMPVGKVRRVLKGGAEIVVDSTETFANGDGLGFFDAGQSFVGFRLNKAFGNVLFPSSPQNAIKPGMTLYRNSDKVFLDSLKDSCIRSIALNITLSRIDNQSVELNVVDARGVSACIIEDIPYQQAKTPQEQNRRRIMEKLGDTIYNLELLDDCLGDCFIPASVLTDARRKLIATLNAAAAATYRFDRRAVDRLSKNAFSVMRPLTYHDNVANAMAEKFYLDHGAQIAEKAIEVSKPKDKEVVVMTTRYCIRRELGACLKEGNASALPSRLFLRNPSGLYRIECKCRECQMKIVKVE